ncbi:MAG: hypothetical protein LBC96_07345 [Lachnospiraceae bacterium]|jgi:hypothetical protein|nr:hypothetical protein [Lachnospiraceae bacterium]
MNEALNDNDISRFIEDVLETQSRNYSCPYGIVHANATSASAVVSGASEYSASWTWKQLAEIKVGAASFGLVHGEFNRRPILGDQVRTKVDGYPSGVHTVSFIISFPGSDQSAHTRAGDAITSWISLRNHHASFSGITYY